MRAAGARVLAGSTRSLWTDGEVVVRAGADVVASVSDHPLGVLLCAIALGQLLYVPPAGDQA
ncbi:hypothetical protein [Lentzea waywayandensis]|uniref:hypothetical protein n=1 Tax=Lentzea waywayandensis TaxID=84724 RepID=UPI0011605956|nr:hypothetical protein [Lentzea waywayandensis]